MSRALKLFFEREIWVEECTRRMCSIPEDLKEVIADAVCGCCFRSDPQV